MGKLLLVVALCACTALGQRTNATLRGQVSDELGGVIVGATVVVVDAAGVEKTATTNQDGNYVLSGLAPGKYTLRIKASGFAPFENPELEVVTGRSQPINVTLKVTIEQQRVTIDGNNGGLSTEPENNAGAITLKGSDLDSLPDDPDDLTAALQALAGPSAGPNGGQIFIDGFSGGRMPPLSSIREVRINQNPFSAEYDRLGMGRIEILTKPGSDKFRGQASFNFNNQALNSRNPFAPNRPPYLQRQYGGNLSGPISKKKASFFLDFEKRDINDDAAINAVILDPSLNINSFRQTIPTPNRRTTFSPRVDYQLNANNTLVARYNYTHFTNITGVGGFNLASRQYDRTSTEQSVNLTETAVINKKIVNETRFQFEHQVTNQNGNNSNPTINVADSFTGGGSQVGLAANTENQLQLQNHTSMSLGSHALKFGGRVRYVHITDIAPQNFGGTWSFNGGTGPVLDANNQVVIDPITKLPITQPLTGIEVYRRTLILQQQGLSAAQIRALGGGASQFTISSGNPQAAVSQLDLGVYAQDDWKVRRNLSLNLGLRYENQDNISSNYNLAPRIGFAWSPGSAPQPKTVVRGGVGIFYDRVGEGLTLTANRVNGSNQKQYIVANPDFFPTIPSIATLDSFQTPITRYQLAKDIQAPYTIQSVISVERQLPHSFTVAASYINARTLHVLRARAINAPLPGTYDPRDRNSGVRPLPGLGNIFQYESSGRFNQNQFIVNMSHRFNRTSNINAFYVLGKANSDTDGAGSFPANSYDLSGEYGPSSQDVRHRFVVMGSFRMPWGVSLNPFLIATSGRPFNITLGRTDLNGDTLFTERPRFATDLTKASVIITRWGAFDRDPLGTGQIIPRNFGRGPASLTTNLRISKTFGFGKEKSTASNQGNRGGEQGAGGDKRGAGLGMGGVGGGMGGPGGRGGPGGGGGGGGRGEGGGFGGGGGDTGKRYNLTVGLNFQNILNHANLGPPVGNLSSPFFGISNSGGGNFGGFGGGRGGASGAYNRLIEASVRFSF